MSFDKQFRHCLGITLSHERKFLQCSFMNLFQIERNWCFLVCKTWEIDWDKGRMCCFLKIQRVKPKAKTWHEIMVELLSWSKWEKMVVEVNWIRPHPWLYGALKNSGSLLPVNSKNLDFETFPNYLKMPMTSLALHCSRGQGKIYYGRHFILLNVFHFLLCFIFC